MKAKEMEGYILTLQVQLDQLKVFDDSVIKAYEENKLQDPDLYRIRAQNLATRATLQGNITWAEFQKEILGLAETIGAVMPSLGAMVLGPGSGPFTPPGAQN